MKEHVIANAVAALLRRLEQSLHLGLVEKILVAFVGVSCIARTLPGARFPPTLYISPVGRHSLAPL